MVEQKLVGLFLLVCGALGDLLVGGETATTIALVL